MREGYKPNGESDLVDPPNTGSHVQRSCFGSRSVAMPEKMYVLLITWREVTMPALLPATREAFNYQVEFMVRPAGISTSAKKLKERADELKAFYSPTFYGYEIAEVQVIDDAN